MKGHRADGILEARKALNDLDEKTFEAWDIPLWASNSIVGWTTRRSLAGEASPVEFATSLCRSNI